MPFLGGHFTGKRMITWLESHVIKRVNGKLLKPLKKKKKKLQETSVYCVLLRMKQVTYIGSTVIPTSSSLEMI